MLDGRACEGGRCLAASGTREHVFTWAHCPRNAKPRWQARDACTSPRHSSTCPRLVLAGRLVGRARTLRTPEPIQHRCTMGNLLSHTHLALERLERRAACVPPSAGPALAGTGAAADAWPAVAACVRGTTSVQELVMSCSRTGQFAACIGACLWAKSRPSLGAQFDPTNLVSSAASSPTLPLPLPTYLLRLPSHSTSHRPRVASTVDRPPAAHCDRPFAIRNRGIRPLA